MSALPLYHSDKRPTVCTFSNTRNIPANIVTLYCDDF